MLGRGMDRACESWTQGPASRQREYNYCHAANHASTALRLWLGSFPDSWHPFARLLQSMCPVRHRDTRTTFQVPGAGGRAPATWINAPPDGGGKKAARTI